MATLATQVVHADSRPGWARWVGGTCAGWTAGFFLAILFIVVVEAVGIGNVQFPLALGMGVGVGLAQARLFGAVIGSRTTWAAATSIGLAAPFIVFDLSGLLGRPLPFVLAVYVALGGIGVAVLQGVVLHRRRLPAAWWGLATPAGWLLASSAVALNDGWIPKIPGVVGALLYVGVVLSGGVLLGVCTAPPARQILSARVAGHLHRT
jgi:hypothetical protein